MIKKIPFHILILLICITVIGGCEYIPGFKPVTEPQPTPTPTPTQQQPKPTPTVIISTNTPTSTPTITIDPPKIESFDIKPVEIVIGQSAILSWKVTGATSVTIDKDIGMVSLTGTKPVMPAERTIYVITASNSGSSISKTVAINVYKNIIARPIALAIADVEPYYFKLDMNTQPTTEDTISTYYVIFEGHRATGEQMINGVYIYGTAAEAEKVYTESKNNNKFNSPKFVFIGDQGYSVILPPNLPTDVPSYGIYFIKNNVYVKLIANITMSELEIFARIVEKRIY